MKLSKLYFEYIKDKHLERKGVTAEDLVDTLKQHGFVTQIGNEIAWTEKAKSKEFKREFWKVIDTTKPSLVTPSRKFYQSPLILLWLCLAIVGQGLPVLQQFEALNTGHSSYHSRRLLPSPTRFAMLIFDFGLPYKGAYREKV